MLLYMQALLTQVAQTAACNRHHSLSKQLCRWLLIQTDRTPSDQLRVTQQMIADMLGVRREGVTEAAGKLHDAGLIHHSRGCIKILDRAGLEERACECYGIVKREFDRMLPRRAEAVVSGCLFRRGSRIRVGLLALPLCGAAVTFFAAAKKVTKESSSFKPAVTRSLAMLASRKWHSPKKLLQN